jgi:hypothetical protein
MNSPKHNKRKNTGCWNWLFQGKKNCKKFERLERVGYYSQEELEQEHHPTWLYVRRS